MLAIYRAIGRGMTPVSLMTAFNTDRGRSWFHGMPEHILSEVADSLYIPIRLIRTGGEEYALNFERELGVQKRAGAEVCVFGDIDLEPHRAWCTQRVKPPGWKPFFRCGRRTAASWRMK